MTEIFDPFSKNKKISFVYNTILRTSPSFLAKSTSAQNLLWLIFQKTLFFGRVGFTFSYLFDGNLASHTASYDKITRSCYHNLDHLVRLNILFRAEKGKLPIYVINFPVITAFSAGFFYPEGDYPDKVKECLAIGKECFHVFWKEYPLFPEKLIVSLERMATMNNIQKNLQLAVEKSKKAREKKVCKVKAKDKGQLTVTDIRTLMKNYCEEVGVKYAEPQWTLKIKGQVRDWIAKHEEPKELLFNICKHWKDFRRGVLRTRGTQEVLLLNTPNFKEIYLYQDSIEDWLSAFSGGTVRTNKMFDNVVSLTRKI